MCLLLLSYYPTTWLIVLNLCSLGYLWWIPAPGMYCAIGAFGQDSCFDTNNNRVIVQQRDLDESNPFIGGNLIIPTVAADPSLSFAAAAPDDESTDESPQGQEGSSDSTMTLRSVLSLLSPMLVLPLLL